MPRNWRWVLRTAALAALGIAAAFPAASAEPRKSQFKEWGENPFLSDRRSPVGPASASTGDLTLNGIVWDEEEPYAVLNNQVVEVGDRIGPWQVVAIEKSRVVVSDGAQTQTLDAP